MRAFLRYNPWVGFTYFIFIAVFTVLFTDPVCMAMSAVFSFSLCVIYKGMRAVKFNLSFMLPAAILAVVINLVFNHSGVSVIFYLPSGNAVTMEAFYYGLFAAGMIFSLANWFMGFSEVISSDRMTYLFGKTLPSVSLLLSMIMRFVPHFAAEMKKTATARRALHREKGTLFSKIRSAIDIFSAQVTISMEDSIKTADSMKCRGYGKKKRTSCIVYRFLFCDVLLIILAIAIFALCIFLMINGCFRAEYFPVFSLSGSEEYLILSYFSYFALCALPTILEALEALKWKFSKSKM